MGEVKKAKLFFNRTQRNVAHVMFQQAQALRFTYPWLRSWF